MITFLNSIVKNVWNTGGIRDSMLLVLALERYIVSWRLLRWMNHILVLLLKMDSSGIDISLGMHKFFKAVKCII
jgi:hypothetical protein